MPTIKISKDTVDALARPATADEYHWDSKMSGFGVRVTPRGVKSYVCQYRMPGKNARRKTLGKHGAPLTPDKARKLAEEMLWDVKRGIDPVDAERERIRKRETQEFEKYVERFADLYLKSEWPDSWQDANARLVNHVVPVFKGRAVSDIKRADISDLLDGLRDRPALARNTHAVLRKLFAWAVDRDHIATSPMPKAPPAVKQRKRTLSPDEIRALWRATDKLNPPFGSFVRLLLITGQRRNEVAGLPWAELSQAESLWTLDGKRAKNDADHLVHLSDLAMTEFSALQWKKRGLVLTTTGKTAISGFSRMKRALDKAMLEELQKQADERAKELQISAERVNLQPWRLHDIRRTVTTQMQGLGIAIEVTEKVINHLSGETSGIAGVYNLWAYQDEKRKALDAWSNRLSALIGMSDNSNVVQLAEKRA